jgi:hypothetical protein
MKPVVAAILPHIIFPNDEPHAIGSVNAVVYDDRNKHMLREELLLRGYEVIDDTKHVEALIPILAALSWAQCVVFMTDEHASEQRHIQYCFIRRMPMS